MSMNPGWDDEKILTVGDMRRLIKDLDDRIELRFNDGYCKYDVEDAFYDEKENILLLQIL